jgi:hypothetical protein
MLNSAEHNSILSTQVTDYLATFPVDQKGPQAVYQAALR